MAAHEPVHWHEGLFLQPHHLQRQQQYFLNRLAAERRLSLPYPYGLIEARISDEALANHQIAFDKLHAIMPSGLEVRIPENCDLPIKDIKEAFESSTRPFVVSLGVPHFQSARANTLSDNGEGGWQVKRVYRVAEVEQPDENTGENPQPVQVRRINARILLPEDDRSDMEVLPLARIMHATSEEVATPQRDETFCAPAVVMSGSPVLRDLLRALYNQVAASRKETVQQIRGTGGFNIEQLRGMQFNQLWRLRTFNRYSGLLNGLLEAPNVTPFEVYQQLSQLLGELAALHPDSDPYDGLPAFDHDNAKLCFDEIAQRIRPLLKGASSGGVWSVPFAAERGFLAAELSEEHATQPIEFYLQVRSREDPAVLATLVHDADRFKVMSRSMIARLVFGIPLKEERHPPAGVPMAEDLHYFRLNRSENQRMWEQIVKEKALAVRWPNMDAEPMDLKLYMTVTGNGGGA